MSEADSQDFAARWSLAGRTALVTGATLGIGLAVAEEFLAFGARVLAVARDAARLEAQVEAWRRAGSEAEGVAATLRETTGWLLFTDGTSTAAQGWGSGPPL